MLDIKSNQYLLKKKKNPCRIGLWIIKKKCLGEGNSLHFTEQNILQFKGCNIILFAWTISLIAFMFLNISPVNNLGQEVVSPDRGLSFLEEKEGWSRVSSVRLCTFLRLKSSWASQRAGNFSWCQEHQQEVMDRK